MGRAHWFLIGTMGVLVACGVPPTPPDDLVVRTTTQLWTIQQTPPTTRDLLLAEAELALRGERSQGAAHIGSRTARMVGQSTYRRTTGGGGRNCSDFASSAEAQRFFLLAGGPELDPHGLDRDGDGFACEWGATVRGMAATRARPVAAVQPAVRTRASTAYRPTGGRCHYVSGYTRRNGTYVRGHTRCR